MKGLNKLGDSLQELNRSSKRVAQINADSANVQSLHNTIESLEARRMQLVLAKLNHIKNPSAAQVIDTKIGRIDTRLSERQDELSQITNTPQCNMRTPISARQVRDT